MTRRTTAVPLAALLAGAMIAGCGDSDTITTASDGAASPAADGNATTGSFELVAKPPDGFDGVSGTAKLIRSDSGTDAAIQLLGLKPSVKYASHVHAGTCDQPDPGGPHFKFDIDGPDMPPNEIQLPFSSDADGNGTARAHNDMTVPRGEGQAIVVHMADTSAAAGEKDAEGGHGGHSEAAKTGGQAHSHQPKIACAALESGGEPQAASQPATGDRDELEVATKGLEPVGGVQSLKVEKGDRVRFTVTSDRAEEVHAHGYDISKEVGPGKPARFDFAADIEGIFEVELEGAGQQIVKLTVNPG